MLSFLSTLILPAKTQQIFSTSNLHGVGESCTKTRIMRGRHCSLSILCAFLVVILHQCGHTSGHIASFISSEGRPNLTPRPIRGPTVPTMPHPPSSSEILRLPGFTFLRGGGNSERKMYLRNMNDGSSFANVNYGISTNILDYEDKPTFVPYIGPRALSSVNEYLKHLRENLEALQSSEDVEGSEEGHGDDLDYGDEETDFSLGVGELPTFSGHRQSPRPFDKQHSRRHVNPNPSDSDLTWITPPQPLSDARHTPNRRQFVEPETFVIRRTIPNNYSPSWSYTKLGLGKRKRGGGQRVRPWQQ